MSRISRGKFRYLRDVVTAGVSSFKVTANNVEFLDKHFPDLHLQAGDKVSIYERPWPDEAIAAMNAVEGKPILGRPRRPSDA